MSEIPKHIEKAISDRVLGDIDPKALVVYLKTGLGVVVGGAVSLLFCGQFGIGITGFAQDFNHSVHDQTGAFACAVICGALFAILPVLKLRGLCSPMQFRAIIRKKWQAPAVWLGVFGALLAYHGNFGNEFIHFIAWVSAAYLIYRYFGLAVDHLGIQLQQLGNQH